MENSLLSDLKKEFCIEIKNNVVTLQELKKMGVSDFALKSEIFLRNLYGEDILINEEIEKMVDITKQKVEKVDLTEISKISEVTKMVDDVSNTDFDRFVEYLNSKGSREE